MRVGGSREMMGEKVVDDISLALAVLPISPGFFSGGG